MKPSDYLPQLTAQFVARAIGLHLAHLPEIEFQGVTTDSRKAGPGLLFVAISGEKFDGNDFVEAALKSGASGVMCRRGLNIPPKKEAVIFQTEDTLEAYRKLAAAWRREFSIPMVAVAGSAGKTTTKELLSSILSGRWPNILKTQGSQNGFVGIPMTLLELRPKHQAAVIEVGIDEIGAMSQHMNLVAPTASVLTAIGPEHLEKLQDLPTVAQEEGIALTHVSKNHGLVVISLDDPWISPHHTTLREGQKICFTLGTASDNIPEQELLQGFFSQDHKEIHIDGAGLKPFSLPLPLLGKHNASNLMAAVAVAVGLGLTPEEIARGLAQFQGAEGRSEIKHLPGSTPVICDYYNAQPASVRAGLELLDQLSRSAPQHSVRWACLGDMLELGSGEEGFHREIAPQLIQLKIENILLFGPRMQWLQDELTRLKFQGNFAHFESHSALSTALTQGVKAGDTLLIKGSRGMKMEEIWKVLQTYAKSHWTISNESSNR